MAFRPNRFKSILVAALCVGAVFGGLGMLIESDYAEKKVWWTILEWGGGALLISFALFFGIWFFKDKRGK